MMHGGKGPRLRHRHVPMTVRKVLYRSGNGTSRKHERDGDGCYEEDGRKGTYRRKVESPELIFRGWVSLEEPGGINKSRGLNKRQSR